jgi:hypothetical protein
VSLDEQMPRLATDLITQDSLDEDLLMCENVSRTKSTGGSMISQRDQILQQVLALPPGDREYVAIALDQSLAGNDAESPKVDELTVAKVPEFLSELQRRSAAYRAGSTTARPVVEVLSDLEKRQTGETQP